jgi:hypothetical protein
MVKDPKKSLSDRFIDGLNCLNRDNLETLDIGVDLAIKTFKKIFQQIQNHIDMNQIVAAGPFLQVFLEEVQHNESKKTIKKTFIIDFFRVI